jgi:hypothetical protein
LNLKTISAHAVACFISSHTPSDRLPAPSRSRPFETPLLPLLRRQAGVILPFCGFILEVRHLILQPDAAVGVDGADPAQVLAVLAEPAEERRVERLDPSLELADELLLDVVEHGLVVAAREPLFPRRPPVLDHFDAPVRRLHVVEPGVERLVQGRGRWMRPKVVSRAGHVGVEGNVPERVAKP